MPNQSNTTTSAYLISPEVKFWLLLIFLVPSILCSLFVLYHFLFDRAMRRSLNNHMIILLLLTVLFGEVMNYPWMLYYYKHTDTWQRLVSFCTVWAFLDWAMYILQLILFAWASIERHILIFHDQWVATRRKRFLVHYLPVIVILIYWLVFYVFVFFFPSCQNTYRPTEMLCESACMFDDFSFRVYETIVNNIIPSLIIVIFSAMLLFRILRQRYRMHQHIHWRKHRKMTVQLLWISALYLLLTAPLAIIIFLRLCGLPPQIGTSFESFAGFISYYIVLLFPFVALLSLPELYSKLKNLLRLTWRNRRAEINALPVRNNQVAPQ